MIRNLKGLGLALIAVLAMSAFAAAGAQASPTPEFFHGDAEKVVLTGEAKNTQEFTPGAGAEAVKCTKASFEGLVTGTKQHTDGSWETASHVTVKPKYENCTFAGAAAKVNTHNCHYDLSPTTTETAGKKHATVDVKECATPITIEVPGLGVTLKIGNQTIADAVAYKNENPGTTNQKAVEVEATAAGIDFTCEPAFLCALGGVPASGTEGTYKGNVTVKGFKYVSGTTGTYVHSEQVGIWQGKTGP